MPLIDIRCPNDHESEVQRPLAMYPATPPCPTCGAPTEQFHPQPRASWSVDPVVVYRAPDGSIRFPGDINAEGCAKYDRLGYDRIELRGVGEVRRFESQMNKAEYDHACRRVERLQAITEAQDHARRSEITRQLDQGFRIPVQDAHGNVVGHQTVHLSERGRALMRGAIAHNNAKPALRATDPGFHVDVYSNNRGSRQESRDPQGRRRRD